MDVLRWAGIIAERRNRLEDLYVYLKHEESGRGPKLAQQLAAGLT